MALLTTFDKVATAIAVPTKAQKYCCMAVRVGTPAADITVLPPPWVCLAVISAMTEIGMVWSGKQGRSGRVGEGE